MATACYQRVKPRTGACPTQSFCNPITSALNRADEAFYLTIPCLCPKDHEPIGVTKLKKQPRQIYYFPNFANFGPRLLST